MLNKTNKYEQSKILPHILLNYLDTFGIRSQLATMITNTAIVLEII